MKMGKIAVRLKNRYALRIAVKEALNTLPIEETKVGDYFTALGCNVCFDENDCDGVSGILPYNRHSGQREKKSRMISGSLLCQLTKVFSAEKNG